MHSPQGFRILFKGDGFYMCAVIGQYWMTNEKAELGRRRPSVRAAGMMRITGGLVVAYPTNNTIIMKN